MSKPLTIEIDEAAAERLAQIANDLGETPEQYAARVLSANLNSLSRTSSSRAGRRGWIAPRRRRG